MTLILQVIEVLAAALLAVAFVCRLNGMQWRHVKARFIVLHLAWLTYCGAVLFQVTGHAWRFPAELLGLACAGLWLFISWPTWRNGVPPHARRQP